MITYRKAEEKDRGDFLKLEKAFCEFYDKKGFDQQLKPLSFNEIPESFFIKSFEGLMSTKESLFLLAENEDKIIGYIFIEINDVFDKDIHTVKKVGHIDSIFVDEEYRGQGIGGEFIKRSIEWIKSKGVNLCTLGVVIENDTAINLYKNFGFKISRVSMFKEI